VTIKEVSGPAGARGTPPERHLEALVVESEVLADNPLGDSVRRPLYVYRAPGVKDEPVPTVYVIQGFTASSTCG